MYAHPTYPLGPLADHAPSLTLHRYGKDAMSNAFWSLRHGQLQAAAEAFCLAAHAAELLAAETHEFAARHLSGSTERALAEERAHRWEKVAFVRARFALQAAEATDRKNDAVVL